MIREQIEMKMKEIVVSILNRDDEQRVDPEKVTLESNFIEDLGADSLDIVEISIEVESVFEIRAEDDEIEKLLTLKDAVDLVVKKVI